MLILASQSQDRRKILKALNLPFKIVPANIDEAAIRYSDFKKQAEMIARAKAKKVSQLYSKAVIISGDTFVGNHGQILEKPKNLKDARAMLKLQSGAKEQAYTGFCYLDPNKKIDFSTCVVTEVIFRTLTTAEIDGCLKKFPVTTWSAAFSPMYHLYFAGMIAEIRGSFTGFTHGLPMELLIPLLRKSGFKIKP